MGKTNYVSPSWRMPRNQDKNKIDTLSVLFDGSNDVTNSSTVFDTGGADQYTISAFIKRDPNPFLSYGYICGDGQSFGYAMSQGGTVGGVVEGQFYMYSGGSAGTPISNTAINANQWYHICIVVDQSASPDEVYFYIDGQLDKMTSVWNNNYEPHDIGEISSIGSNQELANQWEFDGLISQVSFWDEELSEAQIQQLAQGNTQGLPVPIQDYNLGDYSIYDSNNLNTAAQEAHLDMPRLTFKIRDLDDNYFKVNDFGDVYGNGYTGDFGFCCWFKLTGSGSDEGIMQINSSSSSYEGAVYYYTSHDGLAFDFGSQRFETGLEKSTLGTGWNHIAFSTDNDGNHKFWFNGTSQALTSEGNYGTINYLNDDLYIGRYYSNTYVMDGSITGVGFFKQELTNAIVEELHDNGLFYDDPNTISGVTDCVAYYCLTEKDTIEINGDPVSVPLKIPTGITGGTGDAEGVNQDVSNLIEPLMGVEAGPSIGRSLDGSNIKGDSPFASGTAISVNMGINGDTEESGRSTEIP